MGATVPACLVNGFMGSLFRRLTLVAVTSRDSVLLSVRAFRPLANVYKMTGDSRRRRHHRADQVSPPSFALPAFKVPVGSARAAFACRQNIIIHGDAHAAARLTPLEPGVAKDFVQALLLRLNFHAVRARHHESLLQAKRNLLARHDTGCQTQIFYAG